MRKLCLEDEYKTHVLVLNYDFQNKDSKKH